MFCSLSCRRSSRFSLLGQSLRRAVFCVRFQNLLCWYYGMLHNGATRNSNTMLTAMTPTNGEQQQQQQKQQLDRNVHRSLALFPSSVAPHHSMISTSVFPLQVQCHGPLWCGQSPYLHTTTPTQRTHKPTNPQTHKRTNAQTHKTHEHSNKRTRPKNQSTSACIQRRSFTNE